MSYLLEARNLVRTYQAGGIFRKADPVKAVDGVSLTIKPGETLGIVGESGCGKSTLGRMLLGIDDASEGQVFFDGKPLPPRNTPEWKHQVPKPVHRRPAVVDLLPVPAR